MTKKHTQKPKGFTLVEILLVIAIIGLLSSVVLASLSASKVKANVTKRLASAKELENALEVYYVNNKAYPTTSSTLQSTCALIGVQTTPFIPSLTPTYISTLPTDPDTNGNNTCCYMYKSNGTDYKLWIAYQCTTVIQSATYGSYPRFIDPRLDGINDSLQNWDGNNATHPLVDWVIYTPGAANW